MKILDLLAYKSKVKAEIVKVLSSSEQLTAQQIYEKAKASHDITYNGVHKAIRQLLSSNVLKQHGTKYFLSHDWIDSLEKEIITFRRSYEQSHLVERKEADRVALVTGSAKGLGKAIILDLARDHKVVIHYNKSSDDAKNTFAEARKLNAAMIVRADLKDEEQVKKMFAKIESKFGGVDVLVNNVGDFVYTNMSKITTKEFKNTIEGNLYSSWHCIKEVLPYMRKKGGLIINFGCAGCERIIIRENTTPYYIAKTSLYMLTKALAASESKVRINMISPGILETSVVKSPVPLGRHAQFSDMINAVRFLLSKESEYVSGANVEVSGGWVAGF